ncbi:MAG TPA: matrixin family metalloprotease [Methylobacter sp.]
MSNITTAEALTKLIVDQLMGGSAATADALNAIKNASSQDTNSIQTVANGASAIAGIAGVAAGNINMFQQFSSNSTEAGSLAGKVISRAAYLGLGANTILLADQARIKGIDGVDNSTIASTFGSALAVGALAATAPEIATALAVSSVLFTVAGLNDLGKFGQVMNAMDSAVKSYFDSLSPTTQAAFIATLSGTIQNTFNGGMLVPTIDESGQIVGYSMQIPNNVVSQSDGSTISYFNDGIAVVSPASSNTDAASVWTIPQPGTDSSVNINIYSNGNYTYGFKDQGSTILISQGGDSQQFQETTLSGSVRDYVSGHGATVNLSNATVTLSDGATATLNGSNNIVQNLTGSDLISLNREVKGLTIASSDNNTLLASGDSLSINLSGIGNKAVINGLNNTLSIIGNSNQVNIEGNGNYTLTHGDYDQTNVFGNNNNTQTYGNYDFTSSNGSTNTTLSYGYGNNTQSLNSYDTTIGSGTYNTTLSYGYGDNTQGYGYGNNTQSFGDYDTTIGNGTFNTTLSYGYGDNTQGYGYGNNTQSLNSYDTTIGSGTSNTTLSYGYGDNTQGYGYGNNTQSFNSYDTTIGSGTYNTTLSYGYGDNTQSYGYGNNTQSFGNYDTTLTSGTANTTQNYGSSYNFMQVYGSNPIDSFYSDSSPSDPFYPVYSYDLSSNDTVYVYDYSAMSSWWTELYGDWGFAGNKTRIDELISGTQSALAEYQSKQGKTEEASIAQQAFVGLKQTLASNTGKAVYEPVRLEQPVITWSMAQQGSEFSHYMGDEQETAISQAFAVWSEASGLQFQEVVDSAEANIRFGWGDFNTAETGVIGLTTLGVSHDRMKQQAIIRLEDNQQLALSATQDGDLIYDDTEATFSQVSLHEIGHALGLADSTDQSSIEYYYLGGGNRTLSASDRETIQALYGSTQQANVAGCDQLIQAMASFAPPAAGQTSLPQNYQDTLTPNLAANWQ